MFISGLAANYDYDLKKVIALSTLRQLGLIIRILALGGVMISFFHLLTHAIFKALLFICAGIIIHNIMGVQDIRIIGNLVNFLPLTGGCFLISNLALRGFPFLAGFYSKDLILDRVSIINLNFVLWFLFFISTALTVSYTVRLLYFILFKLDYFLVYRSLEDSDFIMFKSILILSILRGVGGSLLN
jgi:NADH-ubiquinone oxidoreductase chain 5